jgi:hypothetical protein
MNNSKLAESEISRLVDEFKSKIIRVTASQSEVSDDIDENEIIEKNEMLSLKSKSSFRYRRKRTDINVILSDIEEYGDDACLLIENDIKVKQEEVNKYKLMLSRKINDIFPDQYKKLSILEEEVGLLKLKLEERKKQTIALLAAAELKGENELSEIRDSEREAISLSKVRQKKYKEARYKEIRNNVDKINNDYRNMGLALPSVDVDSFGNIVLTSELLSLIDK